MTATAPPALTILALAAGGPDRRWRAWAVPVLTAAAWVVAKYEFRGKGFLLTLIDLPSSMSCPAAEKKGWLK